MTKRYLPFLAAIAVASLPSIAQAQKVGPEFQVNQYSKADERFAHVASDSAGNFMVVWENKGYYGNGTFGRTYDSEGNPLSNEFQISDGGIPRVASTNDNFIVVWGDGDQSILGQRYDRDGNRLGGEFQINSNPFGGGGNIASDANGNFVVVWGSYYGASSGRRFDSYGNPLSDEFPIKNYGAVASDANGNFVVVWNDFGYRYGNITGQRYDNTGTPVGDEFQVNTYTTAYQSLGSVATTLDGHFVVVWQSGDLFDPGPDGDGYGISGQLYDKTGNRVGGEFQVNQYTPCSQVQAHVAADKDGNFVVTWSSGFRFCGPNGIYGRRFDVEGHPLTDEFQVNTETARSLRRPAIASASSGSFVVVWENSDGYPYYSGYGIFGQRLFRLDNPEGCRGAFRARPSR